MSFVIISSKLNVRERELARDMDVKNERISAGIGKIAVFVIRKLSPVGLTGVLRESVKIIESIRRKSGGEYKGFIKVGPTAKHAIFIIRGTKYITANNFVKRAKPIIMNETQRLIKEQYNPQSFQVARYFRLSR